VTAALPWRETPDGVAVRLTPRPGRPCLKVRVPAAPVDGAADDALLAGDGLAALVGAG
jgi:hypothetical protein